MSRKEIVELSETTDDRKIDNDWVSGLANKTIWLLEVLQVAKKFWYLDPKVN